MPRGRPKAKAEKATNELLEKILFVGSVLKDQGSVNETHILLSNGYAVAFNGIVASGCSISTNIYAAPNYTLLVAALAKCGEEYSIEPEDLIEIKPIFNTYCNKLKITSGKFKAIVPCLDPNLINVTHIDPNIAPINDDFKIALAATGALASENGQTIHSASILMNGQSLISTENGVLLFEYWHGCNLPTDIAIPKALVAPLTKTTKKLKGFGCSNSTVTFYFEDGSWIRSQIFSEKWPDLGRIINVQSNPFDPPKDLWEGLTAVEKHSVDGLVYFDNGVLRSHPNNSVGASYEVKGLPKGPIFNIKQLMFIKDYVKQIDFFVQGGKMTMFYGDKCRGAIAGRVQG